MNMNIPEVLETIGPDYAEMINAAFEDVVDSHDHTSGKGKKVPTAGLDINAHLNFQSKKAYNLYSSQYIEQDATLTGASNALSVFTTDGDLYYTNGSGNAVQLTSGGSVVTSPGAVDSLEITSINTNLTISPSDTFVVIWVDTSAARTIDLPLASTVTPGRFYGIKDSTGTANANNITVARQGSDTIDGATSQEIDSNYGCLWFQSNGVSSWSLI